MFSIFSENIKIEQSEKVENVPFSNFTTFKNQIFLLS